jgi:DNA-binding response OmpR family regulator
MAGEPIKMLSIDDRTMTTDLDRAGYRKMGVSVRPASNYDEARKILASETIDIVVINMDYRKVDAIQVTKHLKSVDEWKEIPVVITSVQTSAKVRNSALDAGSDLFVEQPLPRQYFIEKLKQLLEQKTRTTERVNIHGDVVYTVDGKNDTCPIGDLSISGMLISTEAEIPSGTKVELQFELPGNKKPIQIHGEVVRTIRWNKSNPERLTGVGIRFLKFQGDSERRLEKYIAQSSDSNNRMQYYL